MGFIDDLVYGRKKTINENKWQSHVEKDLANKGFNERERQEVRMNFFGDLKEEGHLQQGLDAQEIETGIKRMKDNPKAHPFREEQVDTIGEVLKKNLEE